MRLDNAGNPEIAYHNIKNNYGSVDKGKGTLRVAVNCKCSEKAGKCLKTGADDRT